MMGQTAATISQGPNGYSLNYVEGMSKPKVNGKVVKASILLKEDDRIEVGPLKFQFYLKQSGVMIRKATIRDIPAIHKLLHAFSRKGELLPRPLSALYDHMRDFTVFQDEATDAIVGCCALQFCWENLAEIRSLAVMSEHWGRKIGSRLVRNAIDEARSFVVKELFTLTYRPDFFSRFGFTRIDRSDLPLKIWSDCILCVKFPDCDETAMMMRLP